MSKLTKNDVENTSITFDELDYNPCALCDDLARERTNSKITECFRELIEYKAIEEELGIDLITLFKALKNGVWLKEKHYYNENTYQYSGTYVGSGETTLNLMRIYCDKKGKIDIMLSFPNYSVSVSDYIKTWALTREELI